MLLNSLLRLHMLLFPNMHVCLQEQWQTSSLQFTTLHPFKDISLHSATTVIGITLSVATLASAQDTSIHRAAAGEPAFGRLLRLFTNEGLRAVIRFVILKFSAL